MKKLSLRDLSLAGKRVLMRVDFNTPMNKDGTIADDSRIKAVLPSIEYILCHKGKPILISHLGRPENISDRNKLTLAPIRTRLETLCKKPVLFSSESIGDIPEKMAASLREGEILLLENVRFHPGEEDPSKEPAFASQLAKLGDVYVNDAFGTAHRAHSSTALVAKFFPEASAAGLLMEKEISALSCLLDQPAHPFFVVMGGAKISSKIGVIKNLLKVVDRLFIGGGMAYPFLKAKNISIGASLLEPGSVEMAREILQVSGSKIQLPIDLVIADAFSNDAKTQVIEVDKGILDGWQGMDIGPNTIREWAGIFPKAATIFWNGPLGVYEMPKFMNGTREIALALARTKAKVVVGGGDSAAAVTQLGLENSFTHISMGGGATLEYLEFGHLPGIDCLTDA
ncbi:MAG TPA: phosphoglycerate kinase [Chlamydiales bacterium]|jgi:phosphoglycerate kinase|nr:phosphoglycerate kinase [Chlamydiales bacterium]